MNYTELSKMVALVLRHEPAKYGLWLDEQGAVPVHKLLDALRGMRMEWRIIDETTLHEMLEQADKKRFQIEAGKIRAYYGHSFGFKIIKQSAPPPEILFHGTSPEAAEIIRSTGLHPMSRQYVHMAEHVADALTVGRRKSPEPVILRVRAAEAHSAGFAFYPGNDAIWLADIVPAEFIEQ